MVQSFSFGTPVIVADEEPHSPEIDAVFEGENAILFTSDSVDDLSDALTRVWKDREWWQSNRRSIAMSCNKNYSVEKMTQGFQEFCSDE